MATFQSDLPDLTGRARIGSGPAVYIETYGCQMNVYDSQAIERHPATGRVSASADGRPGRPTSSC